MGEGPVPPCLLGEGSGEEDGAAGCHAGLKLHWIFINIDRACTLAVS
jgi:hypothetical protein